jgi:hypothetical protein
LSIPEHREVSVRLRKRHIWFARFNRRVTTLLDEPFATEIQALLDPDTIVRRHNRDWRLSEPHSDGERWLWGKLGFAREQASVEYIDHDYIVRESPATMRRNFVYYVIDLETRVIAFEDRGPDISREGFLGALRQITSERHWEIDLLGDQAEFKGWLAQVDRVTRFYAKLVVPNPWTHAEQVRALIDEPNAERTTVELRNDRDQDGLRVGETVVEALAEHADRGNGQYKATGVRGASFSFFDSSRRWLTRVILLGPDDTDVTITQKISETLAEVDESLRDTDDGE